MDSDQEGRRVVIASDNREGFLLIKRGRAGTAVRKGQDGRHERQRRREEGGYLKPGLKRWGLAVIRERERVRMRGTRI